MNLRENTYLQGNKYKILRYISSGGFGCTYEAEHTLLDTKVAIKEFFVKDYCNRNEATGEISVATQAKIELMTKLRGKFIDEAKALFKMNHPSIVRVIDIFEENGTAYYVMDYIDGKSLQQIVNDNGPLPEAEALKYIKQVADALRYVHSLNRLHLDIKPGNIMIDRKGNAILIDFGASKHYDDESGENTSTLLGINTRGYTPIEQMSQSFTTFNPATDIYSLGATFYKLISGITPPSSQELMIEEAALDPLPAIMSTEVRQCILKSMQIKRKDRPQSIDQFLDLICKTKHIECDENTVIDTVAVESHPEIRTISVNNTSFDMILVEAGSFTMGATNEQEDVLKAPKDEKPSHGVTITKSFYMGKFTVTQKLWKSVMRYNPSYFKTGDDHPVELVSWHDCQKFIQTLNQITGLHFSLPTEAQWEYAARGGKSRMGFKFKYSGGDQIRDVAIYDSRLTQRIFQKGHGSVGQKNPNELGLFDMSGNVWEWCEDWYAEYAAEDMIDPEGPIEGNKKVARGGSWLDDSYYCRVSARFAIDPNKKDHFTGLRLVLNLD